MGKTEDEKKTFLIQFSYDPKGENGAEAFGFDMDDFIKMREGYMDLVLPIIRDAFKEEATGAVVDNAAVMISLIEQGKLEGPVLASLVVKGIEHTFADAVEREMAKEGHSIIGMSPQVASLQDALKKLLGD